MKERIFQHQRTFHRRGASGDGKQYKARKAKIRKGPAQSGSKLILMVPQKAKVKTMELLWRQGIADGVGVGSYEIKITTP
jgi:hypothetical protein